MSPRPYCSHCEGGVWIVDDDGTATKCPHCAPAAPPAEFHADVVGDAHPAALDAAIRIIRDAARMFPTFTANNIRDELTLSQIPGPVVGAAFARCAKQGVITFTGEYVASTQKETHGHPVKKWRSNVWQKASA